MFKVDIKNRYMRSVHCNITEKDTGSFSLNLRFGRKGGDESRRPACICRPELCQPELCRPELSQPELCPAELCQPELCQPELCQPELCQPALCQPELCQPALCRPELCQPGLCQESWAIDAELVIARTVSCYQMKGTIYQLEEVS